MSHRKLERSISKTRPQAPRVDQEIPALLGVTFYDQTLVQVPDRPGYVYARIRSNLSEVVHAFNETVVPAYDLPVLLVRDPVDRSRYRVLRRDLGRYPGGGWGNSDPYLPLHGDTHSFNPDDPGGDIVWVFPQQMTPLLVYPGTTGTVKIYPYTYHYGNDWFVAGSTGTVSLLTYKPTGSSARMVLVYSDYDGNPGLEPGSSFFAASTTGSAQVVQHLPQPPTNCLYPLAGVRLLSGTSSISWSNLYDVRPFFDEGDSTGSFSPSSHTHTFTSTPTYPAIYDDNTFKATGTAIHFDDNLSVVVSGTSVWVDGQAAGSSIPTYPAIYDDGAFQVTGTSLDFAHGLGVVVTGTVAYIRSFSGFSDGNVSQPPTEAELISVLGSPSSERQGQTWVLNDNGDDLREYLVVDDGSHFWFTPLVQALSTTPSLSSISTGTIATHATQWYGRATMERLSNGTWVLVYLETTAHDENDNEVVHIRFSNNQGVTWTAEDTDLNSNAVDVGLPVGGGTGDAYGPGDTYIFQAPNGDLWLYTWKVNYAGAGAPAMDGTWRTKSTDNGTTWGAWDQIDFGGIAGDDNIGATEQHFILDGVIYLAARIYETLFSSVKIILLKSTDNGTTWTYVSDVCSYAEDGHEAAMEYLGNNTILIYMRDVDNTVSMKAVSTDLGATWSAVTEVQSTLGVIGRNRLYTRSHLKGQENWWNDHVLVMVGFVLQNPGSSQSRRNAIWISQDQGDTWTGPLYVDVTEEDGGYGDALWDTVNNRLVLVTYQGTFAKADLVQYNVSISGI